MGQGSSAVRYAKGKKSKKTGRRRESKSGRSRSDSDGIVFNIPLTGFESITAGIRNIAEGWSNFQDGQVRRAEMQRNGQAMRDTVPEVKAFLNALSTHFKHRNILELFQTFLHAANTAAYVVDVLYGRDAMQEIGERIHGELEARTGLEAPQKFARQVSLTIREQIASLSMDGTRDVFFLYHPDTDWYGEFFKIVERNPLPRSFLGMSQNLDAIVIWMLFLKQNLPRKMRRARFHLLIPAYRPMLIKDPLIFPEELYPLTIRGLVHNSKPLVWFDLPTINRAPPDLFQLSNIGNMSKPPSQWAEPLAKTAGIIVGGVGMVASVAGTVISSTVIGPAAAAMIVGGAAASIQVGQQAHESVKNSFARPAPRRLGQRIG